MKAPAARIARQRAQVVEPSTYQTFIVARAGEGEKAVALPFGRPQTVMLSPVESPGSTHLSCLPPHEREELMPFPSGAIGTSSTRFTALVIPAVWGHGSRQ